VNWCTKEFLGYDYKDPFAWLQGMFEIERVAALSELRYKVRSLRTHKLRCWHERRQAALFTLCIAKRFPEYRFDFAHPNIENSPYDAIVRWQYTGAVGFTPLQLKELVPEECKTDASLAEILSDLAKYSGDRQLVVAIYLNRRLRFVPKRIRLSNIGGLFFFGSASPDLMHWILIGDLLRSTDVSIYSFPR